MLFQRTFKEKYKIHILEREQKPYFWFLERNRFGSRGVQPKPGENIGFFPSNRKIYLKTLKSTLLSDPSPSKAASLTQRVTL
jgi:hypothetical protein